MRIEFAKAWPNKNLIRAEIAMLQYKCIAGTGSITDIDLEQYGVHLDPNNYNVEWAKRWTTKRQPKYSPDNILLSGLNNSIRKQLQTRKRNYPRKHH